MNSTRKLREKLAKVEALFKRAGSPGERAAAGVAMEKLLDRLGDQGRYVEPEVEMKFTFPDTWAVMLFRAVCDKHGVKSYRYVRQRRTTLMIRTREEWFERNVWPEYLELSRELQEYFADVTMHLISRTMGWGGDETHR